VRIVISSTKSLCIQALRPRLLAVIANDSLSPACSPQPWVDEISRDHACGAMKHQEPHHARRRQSAPALPHLAKYKLRVTDIASPLFKTDFPGAPRSKSRPPVDHAQDSHGASFAFKEQDEVLEKCIALAKQLQDRSHPLLRLLASR
jgi:hypothetical protein